MYAVIVVRSGPGAGQRVFIGPGEAVTVGRDSPSDLVIEEDALLSEQHLTIACDANGCSVRDLGSPSGTFLGGRRVEFERIEGAGEVKAGETVIRVQMEQGVRPPRTAAVSRVGPAAPPPGEEPDAGLPSRPQLFVAEPCNADLLVVRPRKVDLEPLEVAGLLTRCATMHLIVDPTNAELDELAQLPSREFLFDFLDPEVIEQASPIYLPPSDPAEGSIELLGKLWAKDAAVCLLSNSEPSDLVAGFREALRSGGEGDAVLGIYLPSIMSSVLANGDSDYVAPLIEGIDAVFLEDAAEDSWQLFARQDWVNGLSEIRFEQVADGQTRDQQAEAESDST